MVRERCYEDEIYLASHKIKMPKTASTSWNVAIVAPTPKLNLNLNATYASIPKTATPIALAASALSLPPTFGPISVVESTTYLLSENFRLRIPVASLDVCPSFCSVFLPL